ncbi:hypothetical protein [Kibdelosporangium phytohabitans]|uniref:ESX-1 secretion-associated protein n=1 Tax=Kibdelosporangium phytohabitans TaxID=860235 RepID=A0A0N9HQI8_9PSEU|nr:hypothetical protein [Kibdelosporangium phytohabitans]ALG07006.1 hypothetical protein AOZ06_08760 [Kibdelosporangium phytohabitans]MBE1468295.1 hypothetical protein [Kibdelosporangium phytohabitans]
MPDGYAVDLKVLEAHERELKALVAGLPDASDAASDYIGNMQTFGVLGQFLAAAILSEWTGEAENYVGKVKQAGDDVVAKFALMRQAYDDNDQSLKQAFHQLAGGMNGAKP